ncbi:MAG TPA: hypothetical protein VGG39_13535 [Polyangiaceae bacterium]
MNEVVAVGYWRGSAPGDEALPEPQAFVDPSWDPAERAAVVAYLKRGLVAGAWRGYSDCRFRCGRPDEQMGHRDFTDGAYVWPEGYAHYVEDHGVRPPADFAARALRSGMPPGLERDAFLRASPGEREALCARLSAVVTGRVRAAPTHGRGVSQVVTELRSAGHDLWSFDVGDDRELWCADWTKPSGPGIILHVRADGSCEVSWPKNRFAP